MNNLKPLALIPGTAWKRAQLMMCNTSVGWSLRGCCQHGRTSNVPPSCSRPSFLPWCTGAVHGFARICSSRVTVHSLTSAETIQPTRSSCEAAASCRDGAVGAAACSAVAAVVAADTAGETLLEVVQLVADLVKARDCRCKPEVLRWLERSATCSLLQTVSACSSKSHCCCSLHRKSRKCHGCRQPPYQSAPPCSRCRTSRCSERAEHFQKTV